LKKKNRNSQWSGFAEQLDFVEKINHIVDNLRFIDRSIRTETFCSEIDQFNTPFDILNGANIPSLSSKSSRDPPLSESGRSPLSHQLGWDMTSVAGEPLYRIIKVIKEECRVFRTKARAPSLVVCIVMRDDFNSSGHYSLPTGPHIETQLFPDNEVDLPTASTVDSDDRPNNNSSSTETIAERNLPSLSLINRVRAESNAKSDTSNGKGEFYPTPLKSTATSKSLNGNGSISGAHIIQYSGTSEFMNSNINQVDKLVESSLEKVKEICERRSFSGEIARGAFADDSNTNIIQSTGLVTSTQGFNRSKSASCLSDQEEDTLMVSVSSSSSLMSTAEDGERIKTTLSSSSLSTVANIHPHHSRNLDQNSTRIASEYSHHSKHSTTGRKNSCFLSTNRLNSSAEGILKSALFASTSVSPGGTAKGRRISSLVAEQQTSVSAKPHYKSGTTTRHSRASSSGIQTQHPAEHNSHLSTSSNSSSTNSHTNINTRQSPPNFKVTSASLQINDNLIAIDAADHEFELNEEDCRKLSIISKLGNVFCFAIEII